MVKAINSNKELPEKLSSFFALMKFLANGVIENTSFAGLANTIISLNELEKKKLLQAQFTSKMADYLKKLFPNAYIVTGSEVNSLNPSAYEKSILFLFNKEKVKKIDSQDLPAIQTLAMKGYIAAFSDKKNLKISRDLMAQLTTCIDKEKDPFWQAKFAPICLGYLEKNPKDISADGFLKLLKYAFLGKLDLKENYPTVYKKIITVLRGHEQKNIKSDPLLFLLINYIKNQKNLTISINFARTIIEKIQESDVAKQIKKMMVQTIMHRLTIKDRFAFIQSEENNENKNSSLTPEIILAELKNTSSSQPNATKFLPENLKNISGLENYGAVFDINNPQGKFFNLCNFNERGEIELKITRWDYCLRAVQYAFQLGWDLRTEYPLIYKQVITLLRETKQNDEIENATDPLLFLLINYLRKHQTVQISVEFSINIAKKVCALGPEIRPESKRPLLVTLLNNLNNNNILRVDGLTDRAYFIQSVGNDELLKYLSNDELNPSQKNLLSNTM